jgi:hypothetical protein
MKKNRALSVRAIFEPNRLTPQSLADAYEQILPITKGRGIKTDNSKHTAPMQAKTLIGGVA